MRILYAAPRFPYPPIQGDRVRGYSFLRLLKQRHAITLVAPAPGAIAGQARTIVADLCERWVPVPVHPWHVALQLSRSLFSHTPLQTLYFCPPVFQKQVEALVQAEHFDIIHVQTARMAPVVNGSEGVPTVLDFIDALSLNMERRAMREQGPKKWFFQLEADRMARYERTMMGRFDQQVISSQLDKEHIGADENLHVVPNGVDLERFPYVEEGRERHLIVFTGRMGYFPNSNAALFFAASVFPFIRRQVPDARLLIVGADPPRRVRDLARLPGVAVVGYVPRMQDYLDRATVAVAPMQAGTGLQFKVLEAMASGAPLVVTSYVLGGIAARDGEHVLVANDAETLAEHVVQLLNDPALRRRLARNARRLVEERYTWERSAALLDDIYRQARDSRKTRPEIVDISEPTRSEGPKSTWTV